VILALEAVLSIALRPLVILIGTACAEPVGDKPELAGVGGVIPLPLPALVGPFLIKIEVFIPLLFII
jgi:hypothetical protein